MSASDLMKEFRVQQTGDWWGDALHWWFTVADELYFRGAALPPEWRFRPSPLGPSNDPDDYATNVVTEADTNSLLLFGRALARYLNVLRAANQDY